MQFDHHGAAGRFRVMRFPRPAQAAVMVDQNQRIFHGAAVFLSYVVSGRAPAIVMVEQNRRRTLMGFGVMRSTAMAPRPFPGYAGSRVSPEPSYGNPVPCAKIRLLSNNRILATLCQPAKSMMMMMMMMMMMTKKKKKKRKSTITKVWSNQSKSKALLPIHWIHH